MDSRYLKSLITVVDSGSIADAARIEGLTAAAISQRIQALERQLGFALLSRIGHSAKPTEACLALMPRARAIVREVSCLAGDADMNGLTGAYRIGAISTMLTGILPRALRSLTLDAPGIKPVIRPGTSRSLYQALLAGELDAAILVAPPFELPKTVRSRSLFSEALVLLSRETPVEGIDNLLLSRPYIRYDAESWGGMLAENYLTARSLRPTPLFDLDGLEAIALLVADDVGVSLVPRWVGLERLAQGCVMTPVAGTGFDREILLLSHVQSQRPKMDAAFLAALGK
jgi:DNA-binding transcriptional LysR family regulator